MHMAVKSLILAAGAAPTRALSGFAAGIRNEQLPAQRVGRAACASLC